MEGSRTGCPAFLSKSIVIGGDIVRECSDPNVDLDDLIFDENDGGPSER